VPATLERRLLEAIPPMGARARHWSTGWPRTAAGIAAAVIVALSVWMLLPDVDRRVTQGNGDINVIENDTTPGGILPRADRTETRPCDILPPLPFSS
jgi:hypothetical protein